ncbi:MAG: ATPase [Bacteroidales bacterium]|jgi:hypothetical protein|nr:ATPase [Bacteroidales bacterium]
MSIPFVYGRIAETSNFTDRENETEYLIRNFKNLTNTIIISPRRWGKTSLVRKTSEIIAKREQDIIVCHIDIFNCRTEEQFYNAFASAILKASLSTWKKVVEGAKKYLGRFSPNISFSDTSKTYEISFGVDFKDTTLSFDEILDLPQTIANDLKKQVVVCIDEFQNITDYSDALGFQQKLRSHWQLHKKVCYCLYGSKRHMLLNIFTDYSMPFYKFGDILFLEKIKREDWIAFISKRFQATGKKISQDLCGTIADVMKNHPYYTQQLSQQVWLRTEKECTQEIVNTALHDLIAQLSLLFTNIFDSLTPKQINFLYAIVAGETNFSSKDVLKKYDLGTSANIKNLRSATLEKDLIDIVPGNHIVIQDPVFEHWLKGMSKGK